MELLSFNKNKVGELTDDEKEACQGLLIIEQVNPVFGKDSMHNLLYVEDEIGNTNQDATAGMKEILQREKRWQKIEANGGCVHRDFAYRSAARAERCRIHSEHMLTKFEEIVFLKTNSHLWIVSQEMVSVVIYIVTRENSRANRNTKDENEHLNHIEEED